MALDRLSKIDPLTELFNRRGMAERLAAELGRGQREGKALGILWLDIDYFKEINDRHGHALGDQVLKQVAALISATIRSYDVAARWGGDEFLVLVYPTDQQHLDSLGERLRAAIASSRAVVDANGQPLVRVLQPYEPKGRDLTVGFKDLITRWFTIEPMLTPVVEDARMYKSIKSAKEQMVGTARKQFDQ